MKGYLGERIIDTSVTKFADFDKTDWMMYYVEAYGQIDGEHHKQWVLDQMARIHHGTPVELKMAEWLHRDRYHFEVRFETGEPTQEYHDWVKSVKAGEDGPETYGYDEGIAP